MAKPRKKAATLPPAIADFFRAQGARGGKLGAKKRWEDVPAAARREGARRAALARWSKAKRKKV